MKFDCNFLKAQILGRANRFTARIRLDGRIERAHIPTSGRLAELIHPDNPCYLRPASNPNRLTRYTLTLVEYNKILVHLNAVGVNRILAEAIETGRLDEFRGYNVRREYTWGNSRFDLLLTHPRRKPVLIEAKSVTLCEDGIALFPDAPTSRGVKHLLELQRASNQGYKTYSIFIAQRPDPQLFRPNWTTDPEFGETLRAVSGNGVNIRAYKCAVSLDEISLSDRLPVKLSM